MSNKKRLRVMVSSNAPWSTSGYGQQVRQFLPLIAQEGYPTACIAFYGLEGGRIELDDVMFYPKMGNQWGDDAIVDHAKHFNADVVFTLQDIWTMNLDLLKKVRRWIPIVPVDHEPTPPAVLERLKLAYRIVSYSKFGDRQLKSEGFHSTYIPHTVQTEVFKPMDKAEIRKEIGIPEDLYLFGMVAANKENPPRKSFQEAMSAFARFHKKHPKSAMYFHTYLDTPSGFPIKAYAQELGIQDCIYHPQPYELAYLVGADDMAKVYNSFDCLLSPSLNEGFGVPIIEAQSCGVPAIASNFTAMKDLIIDGETGYKTKVASLRYSPLLSYVGVPDENSIYESMEKIYKSDKKKVSKAARKHIQEEYDLKVVWEKHWKPFLSKLEQEVYIDNRKDNS